MGRFEDIRLEEIYYFGATATVPAAAWPIIRRKTALLIAARRWTTLPLIGKSFPLPGGRCGVAASGNYTITFEWYEGAGAAKLRLEP
jgi:hypothetical protein